MSLIVAKPFNTHLQRFREDDPVAESADLAPHSMGDLKKRKFIVPDEKKADKAN